jgi:hypothetical protein
MTHDPRLDDVEIGELDGLPFRVSPKYRGTLTEDERLGMIASSVRYLLDAIRYAAAGAPRCTGADCSPESHALLASFRRESAELLYSSLNYGFIPNDMPALVRAAGVAFGIEVAEVEILVGELRELVRAYEWAGGVLVTGGTFLFDEDDEDDENMPQYVSWQQVGGANAVLTSARAAGY